MLTAMLISIVSLVLSMPAVAQFSVAQQQNEQELTDERELGEHGNENLRQLLLRNGLGNGSFYRIKMGDNEITVRCPVTLPLQTCVAAALELMKGMEAMPKRQ